MNALKTIYFVRLRNQEFFQFFSQFKQLVEEIGAEALQIKPLFEVFLKQYEQLDIALEAIVKSDMTQQISDIDLHRDTIYKGLLDAQKAASRHFNPDIVEATRKLNIVFAQYGDLTRLPYNEETGKIYNLLQELQSEKYAPLVSLLNLTAWVEELRKTNSEFDALIQSRFLENAEKPELHVKTIRREIEETYQELAADIEAFYRVSKTSINTDFVTRLNVQITYYSNILSQRKGRANAEKTKSEDIAEDEQK